MADRTLTDTDTDPYAWPLLPPIGVLPLDPPVNRWLFWRRFGAFLAVLAGLWLVVAGGIIAAVLILRALVG